MSLIFVGKGKPRMERGGVKRKQNDKFFMGQDSATACPLVTTQTTGTLNAQRTNPRRASPLATVT